MRVALYAGTFDPITRGHLSVIDRGARLFDQLLVVIGVNPQKHPLFSVEERMQMLREATRAWPNVACENTAGYIVELAQACGARYLIRGVRSCTDVESEISLAQLNHELAADIETVFVPAHRELSEVSSSKLKELATQGMDISRYCPPEIAVRLLEKLKTAAPERQEAATQP